MNVKYSGCSKEGEAERKLSTYKKRYQLGSTDLI